MGKHGKPLTKARYLTVKRPDHPIAWSDGRVRVHRANLYDKIGPGPHPCHWCKRTVHWFQPLFLVSDHLDGNTWNNDPDNLVPSCGGCNSTRRNFQATHCKHGHEFTPENTYVRKDTDSTWPNRQCIECANARKRAVLPIEQGHHQGRIIPKRAELNVSGLTVGGLRARLKDLAGMPDDAGVYIVYGGDSDGS